MNEFIEKNKVLLKVFRMVATIVGFVLIFGGGFWFVCLFNSLKIDFASANIIWADIILFASSSLVYGFALTGLVILGIGQFIRYICESESKAGFMVRNGDKLLYIYAVFMILKTICSYFWYVDFKFAEAIRESGFARTLFLQGYILPTLAKVLILIGVGIVLRRIIPVIDESRTLV